MAGNAGEFNVSTEEAEEELNAAMQANIEGLNKWPGMTYTQGIEAALAWVLGERDEKPYTEEDD